MRRSLMDDYIGHDDLRSRLQQIIDNVNVVRKSLKQVAEGPNTVLGASEVKEQADDPVLSGARVLVADDEPTSAGRSATCSQVSRDGDAVANGAAAIAELEQHDFDLIVSDIKMPTRPATTSSPPARRRTTNLPVILMTGFGYDPNHCIVAPSQAGVAGGACSSRSRSISSRRSAQGAAGAGRFVQ
jgi:CheY-like chemotaxis protein